MNLKYLLIFRCSCGLLNAEVSIYLHSAHMLDLFSISGLEVNDGVKT